MHPRVGAVYDINIPALIDLDVVGLDGEIADLHGRLARGDCDIRAADVGVSRRGRNVVCYLFWAERIPDIDCPHPGVEPRDEGQLSVEEVSEIFTARMSSKATTAVAEVTAVFVDLVIGDDRR